MAMDPTRQRLLDLAAQRRVSLASLSRMVGKNGSYLQQFVRKGSPRKLEENDRAMLARFFGVAETELGAAQEKSSVSPVQGGRGPFADWIDVRRLPLQASAGPGATVDQEGAIGSFRFSRRWLRDQGLQPDRLTAITVSGDSMEPALKHGDEILVEASPRAFREGIHVVRLDGALLVKRVQLRRPDELVLLSDNTNYAQIVCRPDEVEVIGRVVWKSGRL